MPLARRCPALVAALAVCVAAPVLAAEPAPAAPAPHFSRTERSAMTFCVSLADTAWTIAVLKKQGLTKEQTLQKYAAAPKPDLVKATVDKVYGDTFKSSWDYAVQFFTECAGELAGVKGDSRDLGAYCMQNTMIAGVAWEQRTAGATQEKAVAQFAPLKSETPRGIVERVYAASGDRGATMTAEWDRCIGPLSE